MQQDGLDLVLEEQDPKYARDKVVWGPSVTESGPSPGS